MRARRHAALAGVLTVAISLLAGCVPSLGPFALGAARGRVVDLDTGEPVRGAEVLEWYRGAGRLGRPQPVYSARWTRTDAEGRFGFARRLVASPRMWVLETYGPTYSFYHPSYGLVHGGGPSEGEGEAEVLLRGSLRHSAQRLADLAPYCHGEHGDPGSRHLAGVACSPEDAMRYPSGTPRVEGPLDAQGRRTGHWTFYYPDGAVAARGEYQAGAPAGTWEFRDRHGNAVLRR